MSSLLEERYRRALRMLPSAYRGVWEEDMVATFLERAYAADPDDPEGVELSSPSRAELASIAALAVRLRLGGVGAAPRYFAWGEAMRRIALVGLLVYAAGAIVSVAVHIWIAQRLPGSAISPDVWAANRSRTLWTIVNLLWVPAFLLLLYGYSRAARVVAWVAVVPILISTVAGLTADHGAFVVSGVFGLLFDALPVLALAAFHTTAPPVRRRPWLVGLLVAAALTLGLVLLGQAAPDVVMLFDWAGLWSVGVCAAALGLLASSGRAGRGGPSTRGLSTPWVLALAVLGWGVFGLRVTSLVDVLTHMATTPTRSTVVSLGLAEATAVLVVTATLTMVAAGAVRRLPDVPPGPTTH